MRPADYQPDDRWFEAARYHDEAQAAAKTAGEEDADPGTTALEELGLGADDGGEPEQDPSKEQSNAGQGAKTETEYYAKQAESANVFYVLVVGLAVLAGFGAAFGATNTMYAAVQARVAEIGTLRALGFSRGTVLQAFLIESIGLAALGLAVGVAIAVPLALVVSKALGGIAFGLSTFSTSVILLRVSPFDVAIAALLALAIGVGGGLAPAWRAAKLRPVEALRKG